MPAASLAFQNVRRSFGRLQVLDGVAGRVESGGVLLVLGQNGSGKSTLLRCLAGLLRPQSGTIEHHEDGRALDAEERRLAIGYVAPDLALYEDLTVAENLELFARLRGLPRERATEVLARIALPPQRMTGALSSGMRQRLRWGWALLHQPAVLLLDEPFQNLDRDGETLARTLLTEHLREGLAVVATPVPLDLADLVDPRNAETLELRR